MLVLPTTNLNQRFRSLDSLDIDACDDDIIPYKIDIQNFDDEQHAVYVTYRPKSRVTLVNVAVV